MKRKTTGVVVARLQVPALHNGHMHLLEWAWSKNDDLVVVLGSPSSPDERNILPFEMRMKMIDEYYPEASVHQIMDHREDKEWSEHLDQILHAYPNPTLYGSRDCFHKHYRGEYPFEEVPELPGISGTDMRMAIDPSRTESEQSFREGMIYAYSLFIKGSKVSIID